MPNLTERTFAKLVSKDHAERVGKSYAHMPTVLALEALLSGRPLLSNEEMLGGAYPEGPDGVRYVLGGTGSYRVIDRSTSSLTLAVCMPKDPLDLTAKLMRGDTFGLDDLDLREAGRLTIELESVGSGYEARWHLDWSTSKSSGVARGTGVVELARSIADGCAGHMGLDPMFIHKAEAATSSLPVPLWSFPAAFTVCWVFYWCYDMLMGGLYPDKLGSMGIGLGLGLTATYVLKWMSRAD